MKNLTVVKVEDLHQCLSDWIKKNRVIIGDYEDMKDMVLKMIRAGHCFSMDRDRLRDAMEDIAFMMNAEDDALKDRVLRSLEYEDEDSDDDFDDYMNHQSRGHTHGPGCKHSKKTKGDKDDKSNQTTEEEAVEEKVEEAVEKVKEKVDIAEVVADDVEDIGDTSDKQ